MPRHHEIELAHRLRQGDLSAFEPFAQSIGQRLLSYSILVCHQREDAEDIVQETLFEASRRFPELRRAEDVHPWFFRIARNACLMKRRRSVFAPASHLSIDSCSAIPIADPSALPEAALLSREAAQSLLNAIAALPATLRMVVLLRYFEGLSTNETATAMDIAPDVVKARLYRARVTIRKKLQYSTA